MTYITSPFYGHYDLFTSLLGKINFNDSDYMFILGNAIGYHEDSMKLLKELSYRQNIYLLLGKQEYYAKTLLPKLKEAPTFEESFFDLSDEDKAVFGQWIKEGGYNIARDFFAMDEEEKAGILDYLEELEAVSEIEVGGRNFVLAFAAPKNFDEGKDIYDYSDEEIAMGVTDYSRKYFPDSFLVTSAVSTDSIPGGKFGKVYSGPSKHLCLGTIEPSQGRPCAIKLEGMKPIYGEEVSDFTE